MPSLRLLSVSLSCALLSAACSATGPAGEDDGDSADRPKDQAGYCAENVCADRLADAMKNDFLQKNFIRWQCGDVPGITPGTAQKDDRGQEYCEYFAVVDGKLIAPEATGSAFRDVAVLGRTTDKASGAPFGFDLGKLSDDQASWLQDQDGNPVVGSCVFTSWHADIVEPSRSPDARDVHGIPVTVDNFRMFGPFNFNRAAFALVRDALSSLAQAAQERRAGAQPAAQHPYWAACMGMVDEQNGEEYRVSDPTIVTAGSILAACGCVANVAGQTVSDPSQLAAAIVPPGGHYPAELGGGFLRGFRLGTWNDAEGLPAGCKYVEHDAVPAENKPDTHTLVTCDIRAADLANKTASAELKEFCRTKYGQDVVVHVPLPGDADLVHPPAGAPDFCEGMTPWSLDGAARTVTLTKADLKSKTCQLPSTSN